MAQLTVRGDELIVRLAWWEKIAARRGDVKVPLCAVTKATVEPSWRRALRGTPGRGIWIPGALCLGVREHAGTRDFVAIRARKLPVTCIDLRSTASPFARIVISDRVPQATAAMVRTTLDRLPDDSGRLNVPTAPAPKPAWLPGSSPAPCPTAGL
ncbi:hypothetical protein [Streptomyces sp. NPDC059262]|uniref:hypothetical protein n=1 Tax=Streptomyces sp. NPDC059262 TaxID=3346797 RepID=UPI0036895630